MVSDHCCFYWHIGNNICFFPACSSGCVECTKNTDTSTGAAESICSECATGYFKKSSGECERKHDDEYH